VIAQGTFAEISNNSGETLEKVFSKLTGREDIGDAAGAFINAFD
jgi:ABC-2 type transport system ATP-binding protein